MAEGNHAQSTVNPSQGQVDSPSVNSAAIPPLVVSQPITSGNIPALVTTPPVTTAVTPSLVTTAMPLNLAAGGAQSYIETPTERDPTPEPGCSPRLYSPGATYEVASSGPEPPGSKPSAASPQRFAGSLARANESNDQYNRGEDSMEITRMLSPTNTSAINQVEPGPAAAGPWRSNFLTRLGINNAPVALPPRERVEKLARDLGRLSDLLEQVGALGPTHRANLAVLAHVPWNIDRTALFVEGYLRGAGVEF